MVYFKNKQLEEARSRYKLRDEDSDSVESVNESVSNHGLNVRAYSSSPLNPSPVVPSRFDSTNNLDLDFLSSSDSELPESGNSAIGDVFFTSRSSRPTITRRERVRDRSLGLTSEKLYRRVNNYSILRQTALPLRGGNRVNDSRNAQKKRTKSVHPVEKRSHKFFSYNGRSKSMHGTTSEEIITKLLERKDRRISVEYMHIISSPLSSSDEEIPRENNDASKNSVALSPRNNVKNSIIRNSSQSEALSFNICRKSASKGSVKLGNDAPFYLAGPEYAAWCRSVYGDSRPIRVPKQPVEIKGVFKSQLNRFREPKKGFRLMDEVSPTNYLSLWRGSDDGQHTDQEKHRGSADQHGFYLLGPEYKAWCSTLKKGMVSSSYQLCAARNKMKVTGMFKSFLNRFRRRDRTELIQRSAKSKDEESQDSEWGDGPLFMAFSHSTPLIGGSYGRLSSQVLSKPNITPTVTRSCFATPWRPRVELVKKTRSWIEMAPKSFLKSNVQLTPLRRNIGLQLTPSLIRDLSISMKSNLTDDSGLPMRVASINPPVRNHTKNMELHVLVDGQAEAVVVPFDFKSNKEKPVVEVVEVLLDKRSIWRRKQSSRVSGQKKSSCANNIK